MTDFCCSLYSKVSITFNPFRASSECTRAGVNGKYVLIANSNHLQFLILKQSSLTIFFLNWNVDTQTSVACMERDHQCIRGHRGWEELISIATGAVHHNEFLSGQTPV